MCTIINRHAGRLLIVQEILLRRQLEGTGEACAFFGSARLPSRGLSGQYYIIRCMLDFSICKQDADVFVLFVQNVCYSFILCLVFWIICFQYVANGALLRGIPWKS